MSCLIRFSNVTVALIALSSSAVVAHAVEPSPTPSVAPSKGTDIRISSLSGGAAYNKNSSWTTQAAGWPFFYRHQVELTTLSRSLRIDASDYKIKIPDANGVMTESSLRVGAHLTSEQMLYLTRSTWGGQSSASCGRTDFAIHSQGADAAGSLFKGYKFGNQVFAYVMGGAEASGGLSQRADQTNGRWVYLGAVAESGVGVQVDNTVLTVGGFLSAGSQGISRETPHYFEQSNAKSRMLGIKGRIAGQQIVGQGSLSVGTRADDEIISYGCEVMVRVSPKFSVGGAVAGESTQLSARGLASSGSMPQINNQASKSGRFEFKAVYTLGGGKKRSASSAAR